MLRTLGITAALIGTLAFGGQALTTLGVGLASGSVELGRTASPGLLGALCCWLIWIQDRRAAAMAICGGAAFTALIVFLFAPEIRSPPAFLAFGGVALLTSIASGVWVAREHRRILAIPNPLRDLANAMLQRPHILEVEDVQYQVVVDRQADPAALRLRVLLQNCRDTAATASVRLEEDVIGEPGIELPEIATVPLTAEGWAVVDWLCPVRAGHRGEGGFHISLSVDRERAGVRTRPWRAKAGPASLTVTQTVRALASKQYLGVMLSLPEATPATAAARCDVRALSEDELRDELSATP